LDFSVESVAGGRQAIDIYQSTYTAGEPFDLVILDLTIPGGIGGLEAARNILQLDPAARLIVSSGYADDPVMASYAELGFTGVIVKPYNLKKLSAVLAQALTR
jgi:CheY-like chemotaxis protein